MKKKEKKNRIIAGLIIFAFAVMALSTIVSYITMIM